MEIQTEDYSIVYDSTAQTVFLQGILRLDGLQAYEPITQLLGYAAEQQPPLLTIDLQELELLNSSGITTLAKFLLKTQRKGKPPIFIKASAKVFWQERSLKNLIRLVPGFKLEFE